MADLWDSCHVFVWGLKKRTWRSEIFKVSNNTPQGEFSPGRSRSCCSGNTLPGLWVRAWGWVSTCRRESARAWPCTLFLVEHSLGAPLALVSAHPMEMLPEMLPELGGVTSWGLGRFLSCWEAASQLRAGLQPVVSCGHAEERSCAPRRCTWEWTWECTRESTRDVPRNVLRMHPGDAPRGRTHKVVENAELGEKHLGVSCHPSSHSGLSVEGDLIHL